MPKSLSGIYGADDNDFAQGIASDALSNTAGKEDVWGSRFDQSAVAKGTGDQGNPDAKVSNGVTSDSRAKTEGNHGKQD